MQRADFLQLQDEVAYLRTALAQLELRVVDIENQRDFELVSSVSARGSAEVQSSSQPSRFEPSTKPALPPLTPERSKTLVDIGRWLRSCLSGTRRGLSGRERLPEGSSCYLVIRARSGQVFDPVKVCRFFNEIQPLVKPRGSPGDSVFIGLPSYRDARLVVEAASLTWPEEVNGE